MRPFRPIGNTPQVQFDQWAYDALNELKPQFGPGVVTMDTTRGVIRRAGARRAFTMPDDMLDTTYFKVEWVIAKNPLYDSVLELVIVEPPIVNGTLVGLLRGERNLSGHPVHIDPYSFDASKTPNQVDDPYGAVYAISHRFRAERIRFTCTVPWGEEDRFTIGHSGDFLGMIASSSSFVVFKGARTAKAVTEISPGLWSVEAGAEIILGQTAMSIDPNSNTAYENASGVRARESLKSRAPIWLNVADNELTVANKVVASASPTALSFIDLNPNSAIPSFRVLPPEQDGKTVEEFTTSRTIVLVDVDRVERANAEFQGLTYNGHYLLNGGLFMSHPPFWSITQSSGTKLNNELLGQKIILEAQAVP